MANFGQVINKIVGLFTQEEHDAHSHAGVPDVGGGAHGTLTGLTTGDDHTQYQKESEKGAASGYASLTAGTKVPAVELDFGEVGDITTQAFSDAPAAGATGEIADAGHKHGMPAAPAGGGLALVGSDLTARSTTSALADGADLSSVTGINIAQGTPIIVTFKFRRYTGGSANPRLGVKINGVQVLSTAAIAIALISGAAESAFAVMTFMPGEANYDRAGNIVFSREGTATLITARLPISAALPDAAIISITLTGSSGNADTTIETDDMRVYTAPV